MPKRIFFNERDVIRLKELSDEELYILNEELRDKVHNAKADILLIMSSKEYITQLVALAETSAKEVARRAGYSPICSNGKYSSDGLTYVTPEFRMWMSCHKVPADAGREFLQDFSFYEALSSQ